MLTLKKKQSYGASLKLEFRFRSLSTDLVEGIWLNFV